jgi:hypothetical protein
MFQPSWIEADPKQVGSFVYSARSDGLITSLE